MRFSNYGRFALALILGAIPVSASAFVIDRTPSADVAKFCSNPAYSLSELDLGQIDINGQYYDLLGGSDISKWKGTDTPIAVGVNVTMDKVQNAFNSVIADYCSNQDDDPTVTVILRSTLLCLGRGVVAWQQQQTQSVDCSTISPPSDGGDGSGGDSGSGSGGSGSDNGAGSGGSSGDNGSGNASSGGDNGSGNGGSTGDNGSGNGGSTGDNGSGNGGSTGDNGSGNGGSTGDNGSGNGGSTGDNGSGNGGSTGDNGSGNGSSGNNQSNGPYTDPSPSSDITHLCSQLLHGEDVDMGQIQLDGKYYDLLGTSNVSPLWRGSDTPIGVGANVNMSKAQDTFNSIIQTYCSNQNYQGTVNVILKTTLQCGDNGIAWSQINNQTFDCSSIAPSSGDDNSGQ
jgi:hypothetical protein